MKEKLEIVNADATEEPCPRIRRDPLTTAALVLRFYIHKARGLFLIGDYQDGLDVSIHNLVPALSTAASAAGCEYDAFLALKDFRDALRVLRAREPFAGEKQVSLTPFYRALQLLEPPGAPDAPPSMETLLALIHDLVGEPFMELVPAGQPEAAA